MAGFWWGFSQAFDPLRALSPLLQKWEEQRRLEQARKMSEIEQEQRIALLKLQNELSRQRDVEQAYFGAYPPEIADAFLRVQQGDTTALQTIQNYTEAVKQIVESGQVDKKIIENLPASVYPNLLKIMANQQAMRQAQEELDLRKQETKSQIEYRKRIAAVQEKEAKIAEETASIRESTAILSNYYNFLRQQIQMEQEIMRRIDNIWKEGIRILTDEKVKNRDKALEEINKKMLELNLQRVNIQDKIKQTLDNFYQIISGKLPIGQEPTELREPPIPTGTPNDEFFNALAIASDFDTALLYLGISPDEWKARFNLVKEKVMSKQQEDTEDQGQQPALRLTPKDIKTIESSIKNWKNLDQNVRARILRSIYEFAQRLR